MQTAWIVIVFDEFLDALDQVFQIAVVVGVYLLPFQRLHKALATCIVVRIPWPAHARHHLVISKHLDVFFASVLHASVGMVNKSGGGRRFAIAFCNALSGSLDCKVRSTDHPTTLREKASRTTAK